MTEHTIGIDISKSHLDAFHLEGNEARQFENSAPGVRTLQKWLATLDVTRIVSRQQGLIIVGWKRLSRASSRS